MYILLSIYIVTVVIAYFELRQIYKWGYGLDSGGIGIFFSIFIPVIGFVAMTLLFITVASYKNSDLSGKIVKKLLLLKEDDIEEM